MDKKKKEKLDKIKNKGKNSFVETPKKDKKTNGKPLGIMDLY